MSLAMFDTMSLAMFDTLFFQGAALKIPCLDRKALDLYTLHKSVQAEGGFETCTTQRKWSKVAARMGYNTTQNKGPIASLLRQHYERVLFPYDVFLSGATIAPDDNGTSSKEGCTDESTNNETSMTCSSTESTVSSDVPSNGHQQYQDIKPVVESSENEKTERSLRPSPRRVSRRMQSQQQQSQKVAISAAVQLASVTNAKNSKELKKLQVFGAGPKMPGFCPPSSSAVSSDSTTTLDTSSTDTCNTSNGNGGGGKLVVKHRQETTDLNAMHGSSSHNADDSNNGSFGKMVSVNGASSGASSSSPSGGSSSSPSGGSSSGVSNQLSKVLSNSFENSILTFLSLILSYRSQRLTL